MSGLVDYSDSESDVSSDGEIVVGKHAAPAAKSAPAVPPPTKQPDSKPTTASRSATTQQKVESVPAPDAQIPQAAHPVPSVLENRFQHFTSLTIKGHDLVDALQQRMSGPSSAIQVADPATYSSALPAGSWSAPPDFRSLLLAADAEEQELASLQSSFPLARQALGQMHHSQLR